MNQSQFVYRLDQTMALKFNNNIRRSTVKKTNSGVGKVDKKTRIPRTKLTKNNIEFLRSLKVI